MDNLSAGDVAGIAFLYPSLNQDRPQNPPVNDFYRIISPVTNKCLGIADASESEGAGVQQQDCIAASTQTFQLTDAGAGSYALINQNSHRCLDVPFSSTAENIALWQYTCNQSDAQRIYLQASHDGLYRLVFANSQQCLSLKQNGETFDPELVQMKCNPTDSKQDFGFGFPL